MKVEPCEPCEWVGLDVPAEHHVGWDQTPLCEYHFMVDQQGKLGNWVNDNVVFPETDYDPTVVESGGIAMKPVGVTFREARESMFVKDDPTGPAVLRKLEEDAWTHLKAAANGNLYDIHLVSYLISFLHYYQIDTSNLEFSLEQINLRKNR